MQRSVKIASNWLLTPTGTWVRYPIVSLSATGEVLSIEHSEMPDRSPYTEFRAGVLVLGLTREAFRRVASDRSTPLDVLLPPLIDPSLSTVALLTGLDYTTRSLTASTQFEYLSSLF